VTQERSGSPEQEQAGEGDERAARLQALLSVDIAGTRALETTPRPPRPASSRPPADVAPVEPSPPPPAESPAPAPPRRRLPPAGAVLSTVVLLALFAAGVGLTYAGTRIIRSSTQGEVVEPVSDPAAPGYEALVDPTPTLAVLHDLDGGLDAITVLTLPDPGGGGGGVVFVPTRVVDDLPLFGVSQLRTPYDFGAAPEVQAEMVGDLLGTGIGEVVVVDADRWAGIVAPVAPILIDNPDDLDVDGELRFPAGDLELGPDDVGPYLEARHEGESDLARLFRHETFWTAWLAAVGEAGVDDAVPGELETGLGRFIRQLARGRVVSTTLPVDRAMGDDPEVEPTFLPDVDGIAAVIADLVPFPRSPRPGVRERVRVLSGTDDVEASRRVAPLLPPAGVEVVIVGNAPSLDVERTTIAYVGPEHQAAAEDLRDLLGVGEIVIDPRPSDVVDITVTLGADHD
jgi:hypothetical protein